MGGPGLYQEGKQANTLRVKRKGNSCGKRLEKQALLRGQPGHLKTPYPGRQHRPYLPGSPLQQQGHLQRPVPGEERHSLSRPDHGL